MTHLPDFISDLAIILITAGIVTLIFKKLKQPVVLGYVVAGFLASLHFKLFAEDLVVHFTGSKGFLYDVFELLPVISDMANVTMWADIGVIFLLFALGLDFSFKKLIEVGGTAAIATSINVIAMLTIGFITGQALGWSQMDSIFLGGMLSMSSTMIILKAFNDMGLTKKKFASIVLAMLVVEDLVAVLLLVLLSTLAISTHFEGTELMFSIFKLAFFILLWFLIGIYIIPTLFRKLKPLLNDETLIVVSIGLCLGMVYFATSVGFSSALGAFVTGSILAETVESKHIEKLLEPLKNIFCAIFFVSVGMMIEPWVVINYAPIILLLTVLVIAGRSFFATVGVLASGQSLKTAVQSGFSVALIGEFSFIIASLGMSLGVISATLYPIIVMVSVLTTFASPFMMKSSERAYNWLDKRLPQKWEILRKGYGTSSYHQIDKQSDWKHLLKAILRTVTIYFTLSMSILLISNEFITPFILKYTDSWKGILLDAIITISIMAPFLRSLMLKRNASAEFVKLWESNDLNKGILLVITAFRVVIAIVLTSLILIPLFKQVPVIVLILISIAIVALILLSKQSKKRSRTIEARFLTNLYRKDKIQESEAVMLTTTSNNLRAKEIHVEEVTIAQLSPSAGKTLKELNFRQSTGVTIVSIIRGHKKINIPDADERLYPFDRIVIVGSDEEIQRFITSIEERNKSIKEQQHEEISHHINVAHFAIEADSPLIGKSIAEADIRRNTECMVIGLDRGDESITRFNSDFIFLDGDVLWLAGEDKKLNIFEDNIQP